MIEQLFIYGSLVAFISVFIWLRFNKVDYDVEKVKYATVKFALSGSELETFIVNIFVSYPESQMCRNSVENGLIYKLSPILSWQYIEVSNASFSPVRCDSIFFTDKSYPKFCWIKSTFLKALFTSDEKISKDLEYFLTKYNLGVEAGNWGAILIRERKAILSSELDQIVTDFKALSGKAFMQYS